MNKLLCSQCGGDLFICNFKKNVTDQAALKHSNYKFNQTISLICYDCGELFDICAASSDSVISELEDLYDFDAIDRRRYAADKLKLEAERLAFSI